MYITTYSSIEDCTVVRFLPFHHLISVSWFSFSASFHFFSYIMFKVNASTSLTTNTFIYSALLDSNVRLLSESIGLQSITTEHKLCFPLRYTVKRLNKWAFSAVTKPKSRCREGLIFRAFKTISIWVRFFLYAHFEHLFLLYFIIAENNYKEYKIRKSKLRISLNPSNFCL
jgi:hypothetical protein